MVFIIPSAPYRKRHVTERFSLDVDRDAFLAQGALAVSNFVHHRDGIVTRPFSIAAGCVSDVILLYLSEKGLIKQKKATWSGKVIGATAFMERCGFEPHDGDCGLFDARLRSIKRLRPKTLLQTAWSGGLPVVWVLTTRSVFMFPDDTADIIRFNVSPLYTIPFATLAYMYRSVKITLDEEGCERQPCFKRFETDAFSCDVYSYKQTHRKCVLSEPNHRWPICKPRGQMGINVQGSIAEETLDEFQSYMMAGYVEMDADDDTRRTYQQMLMLLTLEEGELADLLRRVPPEGHPHRLLTELLSAPWIVTRNLYFARKGTVMPLGADTWSGGHDETDVTQHLGRRAFMLPERKIVLESEGRVYAKGKQSSRQARPVSQRSAGGGQLLLQRRVPAQGSPEGLQGLPAVQDRTVLRCRLSDSRLDYGWAQGKVWHGSSSLLVERV